MSLIFAPLNQVFGSSIVTIRMSGTQKQVATCLEAIGTKFNDGNLPEANKALTCVIKHEGKMLDRVLLTYFAAPKSFTGEYVAELCLHASPYILDIVLQKLGSTEGARFAKPGEFSYRAFVNGKTDLMGAESIDLLVKSSNKLAHEVASQMMSGKTSSIYKDWKRRLIEISALLTCYIDFAEEEQIGNDFENQIKSLITDLRQEMLKHIDACNKIDKCKDGLKICIFGEPNVGKSSLINKMLNEDFAIVSSLPGTTRDVLEANASIAGMPCIIYDTAGIRESLDEIEQKGIQKAMQKLESAQIKILVIDAQKAMQNNGKIVKEEFLQKICQNTIILLNKCESLNETSLQSLIFKLGKLGTLAFAIDGVSLLSGFGYDMFLKHLEQKVKSVFAELSGGIFGLNKRQKNQTIKCIEALNYALDCSEIELLSEDIRHSVFLLNEVLGSIDSEDILDKVFGDFCIGK